MTPEQAYLAGEISAPVALMRLLLEGCPAEAAIARLTSAAEAEPALLPLAALARDRRGGLGDLGRIGRAGAMHAAQPDAPPPPPAPRALFRRPGRVKPG